MPDETPIAPVQWLREDFRLALANHNIEPTEEAIDTLIKRCNYMNIWRDLAIERGNELIDEQASDMARIEG